jgi:hypothetical protein
MQPHPGLLGAREAGDVALAEQVLAARRPVQAAQDVEQRRVDLPEPLGPISATISPCAMLKSTPRSTGTSSVS